MSVFDVRAKLYSTLGQVISGSASEDHAQGKGLILCSGSLELAELSRPAIGSPADIAYVPVGTQTLVRFPRKLFVVSSFASPFTNTTKVELGCKLTLLKERTANRTAFDGLVTRGVAGTPDGLISAQDLLERATTLLELPIQGATLAYSYFWESFSLPRSLVELIDTLLSSEQFYGFADLTGGIQCGTLAGSDQFSGPLVPLESVLDLAATSGGGDPSDEPQAEAAIESLTTPAETFTSIPDRILPDDESELPAEEKVPSPALQAPTQSPSTQQKSGWENNMSSITSRVRIYREFPGDLAIDQYFAGEEVTTVYDNYDGESGMLKERKTVKVGYGAKDNAQIVLDYLIKGLSLDVSGEGGGEWRSAARSYALAKTVTVKKEFFTYQAVAPLPLTPADQKALAEAGQQDTRPPTYKLIRKDEDTWIGILETLGKLGIKDYAKTHFPDFPSPVFVRGVTEYYVTAGRYEKTITQTRLAYGVTEEGQQYISKAASKLVSSDGSGKVNVGPLLETFSQVVFDDTTIAIRTVDPGEGTAYVSPDIKPINKTIVDVTAGLTQQSSSSAESPATGGSYPFKLTPADWSGYTAAENGGTTEEQQKEAARGIAEKQNKLREWAAYQNSLRFAYRLGMQFTTPIGVLPALPLSPFFVTLNGAQALYLTNGTSWAFDANGILQSTDALYWGAAGGDINGAGWVPLPPGTTTLPAPAAVTTQEPSAPIYSVELEEELDITDQAAVTAAIQDLPVTGSQVFAEVVEPTNVIKPYRQIVPASFAARALFASVDIYGPAVRDQGPVSFVVRVGLKASYPTSIQARALFFAVDAATFKARARVDAAQTENSTFSASLGISGNLS